MEKHSNARSGCRPRHFNKRALTAIELIAKLRRQGMVVNVDSALPYLQQIGAFRMKGYWYPWQDKVAKTFKSGACFDDAIRRYEFDRELRRITASALESIEIMVRTVFSEVMAQGGGPHWFLKASVFGPAARGVSLAQRSFLQKIEREVARMQDKAFITHYKQTYDSPALPPSWVISECLSFGALFERYPDLDKYALLGFPQDWFSQPLWLCGQRRRG